MSSKIEGSARHFDAEKIITYLLIKIFLLKIPKLRFFKNCIVWSFKSKMKTNYIFNSSHVFILIFHAFTGGRNGCRWSNNYQPTQSSCWFFGALPNLNSTNLDQSKRKTRLKMNFSANREFKFFNDKIEKMTEK